MADLKISALTASTTPLAGTEVLPIVQSSTTKQVSVANLTAGRAVATGALTVTGAMSATTSITSGNGLVASGSTVPASGTSAELGYNGTSVYFRGYDRTGSAYKTVTINEGLSIAGGSAGDVTLIANNLVVGASGKGIDFSATPGTGTSELLADYEEGTWTPAFISTGATFAYAEQYGSYVKVGNMVTLQMRLRTSSVTGTTSNATNVTGIPFASANLNANNASAGAIGLCDVTNGLAMSIGNNEATLINLWNFGIVAQPTAASIDGKYFFATISYRTA
jgi:hypothetical protein